MQESAKHSSLQTVLPSILIVGDLTMKAGIQYGPRTLKEYELVFYPNGSKTMYISGNETVMLLEPCFLITRPGESHVYHYDSMQPTRHLFIHFTFEDDNLIPDMVILQPNGPSYIPARNELLIGMMKQIMYIAYSYGDRLQKRGSSLLLALLEEINGIVNDSPQATLFESMPLQIVQALKFIDKNLHLPLNIKKLAQHVGWTHEHFSRLFVQHMGRSPRDAIIERRIERSCQLLLHKEWSIKQIAYSVGYLDENYFCRVFKTIKGMTASEYRLKNFDPRFDVLDAADLGIIYPPNSILYKVGSYSDGN